MHLEQKQQQDSALALLVFAETTSVLHIIICVEDSLTRHPFYRFLYGLSLAQIDKAV